MTACNPLQAQDFSTAVQTLDTKSFSAKEEAISALVETGGDRTLTVLQAMLEGNLHSRNEDGLVVILDDRGGERRIYDAAQGNDLGTVGARETRKIGINNSLRTALRGAIARLNLGSPDATVRLAAVQAMFSELEPRLKPLLQEALAREEDGKVRDLLTTAIAISDLENDDTALQLEAIEILDDSILPEARNRLAVLAEQADSPRLREAAHQALKNIEFRLQLYALAETIFFGMSLGSVLLLAAIGLAITFGVMGVINMAHGELIMLGAYTTYLVQLAMPNHLEWSMLVAVPAAFLVSGAFGVAIERSVIRFLYGRPLETLLATFGISLILQQLVRSAISAQNVTVANPGWMSGSLEINAVLSITYNRLYIVIFALLVFVALLAILKKTTLGLQVRAVAQNRPMARAMGIRSEWVDAMTFGLGSGIAGVAGVALSQITNVGPNMGQAYIIDSFMVVVFGGVANLWGTLVGAFTLGIANKFLEPYSGAVLAKILILVFIILFIQKRPRGLFPQKGRMAEN
ncbi:MAG: urea ABC transporter permease subunit UrtB [Xanthomonadaceae bacterium]|nr:urea ABC transporter permease subunit UrtB [Xanthomonadaceae bacterium]